LSADIETLDREIATEIELLKQDTILKKDVLDLYSLLGNWDPFFSSDLFFEPGNVVIWLELELNQAFVRLNAQRQRFGSHFGL